jgi:thiamine biosynthesis lipoprotein
VSGATDEQLAAIGALIEDFDARFSRFRAGSELCRVNASRGRAVLVSEAFAVALTLALAAARSTGGLVDPTLGAALEAAGYDGDFVALPADDPAPPRAGQPSRLASVRLSGRVLERPPGVRLDLNGVVKAMAVDAAVALLGDEGWVSLGGDLATRGPVDVALPGGGAVRLVSGALATSSTLARRWRRGGAWQHHLIDPRSGRPACSPWTTVTACGATCVAADVAAKAGLLAGPGWLEAHGIPARLVHEDGTAVTTSAWCADEVPACT